MQKLTLLQMTQNILSAMSSDDVNSISDTVESLQVAEEVRTAFYDIFTDRDIPEFEGLINLESLSDPTQPNKLNLPSNVANISWVKYRDYRGSNTHNFTEMDYLSPEAFLRRIVEADISQYGSYQNVLLLSTSPVTYPINTMKTPSFYTVFDEDATLVFDSFDSEQESFLTGSNALVWGIRSVEFLLEDDFIPPIDAHLFPYLLSEAKSACFINIKEVANSKEEQRARRHLVRSQTRMHKIKDEREGVFDDNDYSRKRGGFNTYRRTYYR